MRPADGVLPTEPTTYQGFQRLSGTSTKSLFRAGNPSQLLWRMTDLTGLAVPCQDYFSSILTGTSSAFAWILLNDVSLTAAIGTVTSKEFSASFPG